jgi:uncharacterized protein (DUF1786 family)
VRTQEEMEVEIELFATGMAQKVSHGELWTDRGHGCAKVSLPKGMALRRIVVG